MTFNDSLHPRDSLGQFSEKLGIAPEAILHGADSADTGVSKHWPKLSTEIGLNGYSQKQVADQLQREDGVERRMRSWDTLPSGDNAFPAAAADRDDEFERVADDQGIVAVGTHPNRLPDGRYSHEMVVARDGFYGSVKGRFLVLTDSSDTPSAAEAIRQSINPPVGLGERGEMNKVAHRLLFSSDEAGEDRALLDAYARSAVKNPSTPTVAKNLQPGHVVAFDGEEPGIIRKSSGGDYTNRIDTLDGRVYIVGGTETIDRW